MTEVGDVVEVAMVETDARVRLIEAAIDSFAAKGFHATTTRDIAAAAGMSQAALYVHYASKEDVLNLICRSGLGELLALMDEAYAGADEPRQQLADVVRSFAVWHAQHSALAKVANYEFSGLRPDHWAQIRGIRQAIELRIRGIIESGMRSGDFDVQDSHMTTFSVISMGSDIARWYRANGTWTVAQVADHYSSMVLRLVGAQPRPEEERPEEIRP